MALSIPANIDLSLNEIQNVKLQSLASDPSDLTARIYYNTTSNAIRYYNGSAWVSLGVAGSGGNADTLDSLDSTYFLSRTNHSGSQTASTISDFDTAVRTSRLDQMAAPTSAVSMNSQRVTSVSDPSSAQDAATKAYVDAATTAAANGLTIKTPVRAATTASITLSGTQTIDGVAVIAGDRVLVKNQGTGSQNGIYVAAAGSWSRATDADSDAEVKSGMYVMVTEGTTNDNTSWVLTTNNAITVGTTALTFTQFSGPGTYTASTGITISSNAIALDTASGYGVRKYATDIGNGSATEFTVTHNLGTRDVIVQVRSTSSPWAVVLPEIEATSTSVVTVRFTGYTPTSGQFRVIVTG